MSRKKDKEFEERSKVPLWKWILIIILILALPLFFAYYRNIQIQQALAPIEEPSHAR